MQDLRRALVLMPWLPALVMAVSASLAGSPRPVRAQTGPPLTFTVAIDPGHGGSNLGAQGPNGVLEKQLTLDLAHRIEARLNQRGQIKTVLCRTTDMAVPVRARVRCANEAGARLFLSLHANSSPHGPRRGTQRGFELYVLGPGAVAADARAAAATAANPSRGAFAAHRVRATARESVAAASRVAWRLGDALGVEQDRGIKQAGATTDVLEGLQMPGVLVEVGFLDYPVEGPLIVSEHGRGRIAEALARAIEDQRSREWRGRSDPSITSYQNRDKGRDQGDQDRDKGRAGKP